MVSMRRLFYPEVMAREADIEDKDTLGDTSGQKGRIEEIMLRIRTGYSKPLKEVGTEWTQYLENKY